MKQLKHYDGTLAPRCPCCGSEWDNDEHEPIKETRGWNYARGVPAWVWTCKACLDDETA